MTARENLLNEIEELKKKLNKLISERACLQDKEIIKLSTAIDLMLNEYNLLLNEEKSKSTILG